MDLGLRGRRALVTGASKGIGAAVAEYLAEEGVNLVLVARNEAALRERQERIRARWNVHVEVDACDLTEGAHAPRLAAAYPDVDILVNNAGAIPHGTIDEVTEEIWRRGWDLKVFGYVNMCRAFYAPMKARRAGVIVNIIGLGGERMDATYIAGSSGNASLMAFTRALGGRAPDDGLRVVGINPGAVLTDRLMGTLRRNAAERLGSAERWPELVANLPMGRAGKPEEIAWLTAFLASDRAGYVSGTIVTADCGFSNRGQVV